MDGARRKQETKPDDKSGQATSQTGAPDQTYDLTKPDIAKDGATLAPTVRLVRLGSFPFIDLTSPDVKHRKNEVVPYLAQFGDPCSSY